MPGHVEYHQNQQFIAGQRAYVTRAQALARAAAKSAGSIIPYFSVNPANSAALAHAATAPMPKYAPKKQKTSGSYKKASRSLARPLTFQRDQTVSYRRKRVSRRTRRRATRSLREFYRNSNHLAGSRYWVSNDFDAVNIIPARQGWIDLPLMTTTRIAKVMELLEPEDPPSNYTNQSWATVLRAFGKSLIFKNFRAEHEVHNTGDSILYLDIYFYNARYGAQPIQNTFGQLFGTNKQSLALDRLDVAGSVANAETTGDTLMGLTPFMCQSLTQSYTITSVRRVMLQPGQSMTYQMKMRPYTRIDSDKFMYQNGIPTQFCRGSCIVAQPNVGPGTVTAGAISIPTTEAGDFSVHTQLFASCYSQQTRKEFSFIIGQETAINDGNQGSTFTA